jgi:hypothetical protein
MHNFTTARLNQLFELPTESNEKFGVYIKDNNSNIRLIKFNNFNIEIKLQKNKISFDKFQTVV